jgi:hypothetical protein
VLQGTFLPLVVPPSSQQMILWSTWLVIICSLKVLCATCSEILSTSWTEMHVTSRCFNPWPENVWSNSMLLPQQLHQNISMCILHCCWFYQLIYCGTIPVLYLPFNLHLSIYSTTSKYMYGIRIRKQEKNALSSVST